MSYWLHDETISLDLLAALPHVDEHALGVVGCSGGGTQSSYLAARHKKIKHAPSLASLPRLARALPVPPRASRLHSAHAGCHKTCFCFWQCTVRAAGA